MNIVIRKTKRYVQVAKVLVNHGFAEFVDTMGLATLIEEGWELIGKGVAESEKHERLPREVRLRMVLEELGTTFIKLGQILSTRPDMIPPEFVAEFKKLQSDTPKAEFSLIRERLEAACPDGIESVFESVEETPLASASIAQVHRAVLLDGTPIVLKILRPGAEEIVQGDIAILKDLAALAEKHVKHAGFSPTEVVDEFARTMEVELDFVHEARATEKLANFFADDDAISFPEVHWEATSREVLALEEVIGVQLSEMKPDSLTQDERRAACGNAATAVFRMCLELGYFHADPHPGNIFVKPGGAVAFIDCGMTGHIEKRVRFQLGQFVRAVLEGDLDRTVRLAVDISDADPGLEQERRFRAAIREMINRFETPSLEGFDLPAMLDHFFGILRKYGIRCPADLVYLIKALATIEGVAEELDPGFDIIAHLRPLMAKLIAEHYGLGAIKERLLRGAEAYLGIIEELPQEIRELVAKLRRENYEITLKHEGLDELRDSVSTAGRFVAMALILAALLLSSSVLILSEATVAEKGAFTQLGRITFVVSLVFVVVMVVSSWRRRPKKKK